MKRPVPSSSGQARGVALIMAVSVLAALVAISVPFLLSMVLHGRAARVDLNATQAQAGADGALAHGLAHLYQKLLKAPGYDPTPDVDTVAELKVDMALPNLDVNNPNGELWSCKIEDEQGKVNLNSAPPNLIGNLLASTTLAEPVQKGSSVLLVNDSDAFPTDGDPATLDGVICIEGEVVPYCHVAGGKIALKPEGDYYLERNHRKGALVYDGRAHFISNYKFQAGSPLFRPFRSIYELKVAGEGHPLLAVRADEFAQIERFVTAHSGRDGPMWGKAEICTGSIQETQRAFTFRDNRGFGPGTIVRVAQQGSALTYARVERVFSRGNRTTIILENEFGINATGSGVDNEIFLEPEMRHPININTAPPEVIAACIIGVGPWNSAESVTRGQGNMVAQWLARKNYLNAEEFKLAVDEVEKRGILNRALADAIYINASEPNSPKIRGNTVPFCYRSYGSFTVEGSAVMNAENGIPLARSTLRQVVTLPTPPPGRFELKTQVDFEDLVDKGLTQKVVTWPIALNQTRQTRGGVRQSNMPDTERGAVRLSTGDVGSHGKYAMEEFISHCDDPNDRGFFQEGYDLLKRGNGWQLKPLARNDGYMPTTGVEMWFKPQGGAGGVFFDMGESANRNRVLFQSEAEGLTITIWDANLQQKYVRYVYPYTLDPNDWQHIAGSWRTSASGGQEVRVDANPIPQQPARFEPGTSLSADLDIKNVSSMSVDDATAAELPQKGAVLLGDEVIEYDSLTGNVLSDLKRGSRMTTAYDHQKGEAVSRYGYFCAFAVDHPEGRGFLVGDLPIKTSTRVFIPKPPNPINFVLDDEIKEIPVQDASDFPASGFVNISGEIIYYDKKDVSKSPHKLQNLKRAQSIRGQTGPARNLYHNSGVSLCSIQITNSDQYNSSGVVQIDKSGDPRTVEWLDYGDKVAVNGKHFLLAEISTSIGDIKRSITEEVVQDQKHLGTGMRGSKATPVCEHDAGEKVIPVARMSGPHCGDQQSAYGEGLKEDINTVSVVTRGQASGDLRFIKRAYVNQWANTRDIWRNGQYRDTVFVDWGFEFWAGLDDFVSRRFPAGQGGLLRWPSGELPNYCTQRHLAGAFDGGGQLEGDVDEVKLTSLPSLGAKIARLYRDEQTNAQFSDDQGFTANDSELYLEVASAWPRPGGANWDMQWPASGLIRIDDEFIFYKKLERRRMIYLADRFSTQDDKLNKRIWNHPKTPDNPGGPTPEIHPNYGDKNNDPYKGAKDPPNYDEVKDIVKLSDLQRGVLNTDPADHTIGAGAMLYDAAPFTVLNGGLPSRGGSLSLVDARGFPQEDGYAWINDEVVSWYKKGYELGPFRGRFGTAAEAHAAGDLVRCLPYRYWDRNVNEYDGDGLAFIQAGHFATDAVWQYLEVKYDSGAFGRMPLPTKSRPRILVRFNGQPAWSERPTNREGGLFQFFGGGKFPLRGRGPGGGVVADQIEIRIYWHYDQGAFVPQPDWKRCFGIKSLKASYFSPLVTRRVDEIERR